MVHLIAMRSEDSPQHSIVLFVGATAVGKSALALHHAQALQGEIVNADSVQVYKRLNIGSAKASAADQALVKHHLLDLLEPNTHSDAQYYCSVADPVLKDIIARGQRAFVVGGTGLYTRALVRGLAPGIPSDPTIRSALNARAKQGLTELAQMHRELTEVDPVYAAKIAASDPIRIVRALEVWQITNIPYSSHHAAHALMPARYRALWVGLDIGRDELRRRLNARTQAMFAAGWYEEVRDLLREFPAETKVLQSVGYAEVVRAVQAQRPVDQALIDEVVQSSMAFAKRQRTWFRGEADVQWMTVEEAMTPAFAERIQRWCDGESP